MRSSPPIALSLLALAVASACGGEESDCFIGDPAADPDIQPVYRTVAGEAVAAADGEAIPLLRPPQGGQVMLVGVRARNVPCRVELTALLRDECNGGVIASDRRPVNLVEASDGFGDPMRPAQLEDYANLPACPSESAVRDVEDEPYTLVLRVERPDGATAERELEITPYCAEPELEQACKCECDGDFDFGGPCEPEVDGGPPPGTCP